MPRDNFSAKVVERLRTRVAYKCSNPDCRVPTVGPGNEPLAVANIGKAAHITAAAPGGPRYVATMTPNERSSINNAIWLCSNCATKIDVDRDKYPVTLLQEWKRLAEHTADSEKGKRPPHPDDARNQLVAALSGMPVPFTRSAIHNVHSATEQALHNFDPRFHIETSYNNKVTTYLVHALENVNFKLKVPVPLVNEWHKALQSLLDHGRDVVLPAGGVEINGLPLLEQMFSGVMQDSACIMLESKKRPAVQKLKLLHPNTQLFEQFDDLVGYVSLGRKSLTFEGTACGNLLAVSLNIPLEKAGDGMTFKLTVRFSEWDKYDLRYLPHFDKLSHLFEILMSGWLIDIGLEIEGLSVLRGKVNFSSGLDEIGSPYFTFQYIALIRKIAAYMNTTVMYVPGNAITQADFQHVLEIVDIIEGRSSFDKSALNSNPTCHLIAQDGTSNIRYLIEDELIGAVAIRADDEEKVIAFGQEIQMPKKEVQLNGVRPKVHQADMSTLKDGDVVLVEWEPSEEFRCSIRYMKDE